jgi:hypothetical protein
VSATPPRDRPRWDGAVSAGLGAGFGYVLFHATLNFWNLHWEERFEEALAIALVGLGIMRFLEPLIGRLRSFLGIPEEQVQTPLPERGRRLIRITIFAILALASVSHAFLHNVIKQNVAGVVGILVVALLIPGGTTYAWLVGARKEPPRSARYGAATGLVLGALHLFVALVVIALVRRAAPEGVPFSLADLERMVIFNGLAWGALGAAGGLVIDRFKGPRPAWRVAVALVVVAVVLDLPMLYDPSLLVYGVDDFAKIVGWGLGLIAYPRANRLFMTSRRAAPTAQA